MIEQSKGSSSKRSKVMKDVEGYFKYGERTMIYKACTLYRDKVLIRLLWKSGKRITEILKLQVKHVNFRDRKILWYIEKKGEEHKVWQSIDDWTLNLLKFYIKKAELNNPEYYFIYPDKTIPTNPITRQRAFQIVRRLCKKVGIEKVGNSKPHPHHFRHSFAIDLAKQLKSPADVRKLQQIMQHSSLIATEQYLQFGPDDLRALIDENPIHE